MSHYSWFHHTEWRIHSLNEKYGGTVSILSMANRSERHFVSAHCNVFRAKHDGCPGNVFWNNCGCLRQFSWSKELQLRPRPHYAG